MSNASARSTFISLDDKAGPSFPSGPLAYVPGVVTGVAQLSPANGRRTTRPHVVRGVLQSCRRRGFWNVPLWAIATFSMQQTGPVDEIGGADAKHKYSGVRRSTLQVSGHGTSILTQSSFLFIITAWRRTLFRFALA